MQTNPQPETVIQTLLVAHKKIVLPRRCKCGNYLVEPYVIIKRDKITCYFCKLVYELKENLDEKAVNQMIDEVKQHFSGVTKEMENNLTQIITFYHQKLVDEMQKTLQNQTELTTSDIRKAYDTVNQRIISTILENIQMMKQDLKADVKQLSKQQETLLRESREQYQDLLQQTQLIVDLIKRINSSSFKDKSTRIFEEKPKRKLKYTDFNPEEFAPI